MRMNAENRHVRKTTFRVVAWTLAILALAIIAFLCVTLGWYIPQKMDRYYALGSYGRAYELTCFDQGVCAPTLEEIEAVNNAEGALRRTILPISPDYMRPIYRPVNADVQEEFLIFIECLPDDVWIDDRWVIFAPPNGATHRIEWLDSGSLDEALKEDDDLRARSCSPL